MELALAKLNVNKKVRLHDRFKITIILDYLESQQVSVARRIRYLQNLTKLAVVLEKDSEKASKADIETAMLPQERLDPTDYTKRLFRIMTRRF